MKNLLLAIPFLLIVSCSSKEEKANELIKADMFKSLYDYESYQPIETIIDSSFIEAKKDSIVRGYAYLLIENLNIINKSLDKVESEKRSLDIWSDSYSLYGRGQYLDHYRNIKKELADIKGYMTIANTLMFSIKTRADSLGTSFIGWEAKHKFRCKNKGGNPDIGNYLYVFDKDMKRITYKEDLEDKDIISLNSAIDDIISGKTSIFEIENND